MSLNLASFLFVEAINIQLSLEYLSLNMFFSGLWIVVVFYLMTQEVPSCITSPVPSSRASSLPAGSPSPTACTYCTLCTCLPPDNDYSVLSWFNSWIQQRNKHHHNRGSKVGMVNSNSTFYDMEMMK